ncbi:hypothetical protein [Streptomyces sp. NPDC093795]|uniref:hypothetical protein n=1 Tax=Streptomyces sp. NPDC093795 TaxID=3366051 RepID=UPI0038057D1C
MRARQAAMTRAAGRPAEAFDIHFRLALSAVERGVPRGELHGSTEALAREAGTVQQAKWTVIRAVADWYETGSMLAETVPALREIADKEDPDTGLLCCFVLEQALVDGLFDLPAVRSLVVEPEKAPHHLLDELRTLSERADSQDVEIRARLACALADTALTVDSTIDQVQAAYGQTITRAGAGRFQHARGLIQSRAAYAFAVHGDPEHAEDLWRQSVLASSEDGFFGDARHALRAVRKVTHDRGSFVWGLDRVTRALPNRRHLLSGAVDPALTSHAALHREKLPDAFGDTRRYLWESRLQGALQEEVLAMELFGDVLQASGYAAEAVDAYLYAGAAKKAAETAGGLEDVLDVGIWLRSPVRARRAAAIQVIGAQAALIEDADMAATVTRLAAEAQGVWTTSAFRPHPERDALDALTALAYRFPAETVDSILSLVEPALQQATRYNDEVAAILVSALNFTGHSRSELTSAISRMMELPNQHDLWNMLERLALPCRAGVLPAVETHAAAGLPEALDVLQSWFPASERAQRRARASCASLLREPVGVPRAYSRLDSGAGETVGLLLDLLARPEEELVEVPAASLGPDPTNPEDAVALALNEATNVSAAETHDNATGLEAVAALTGDEAAHTAATRPAELAATIARRLIAMVEDHYDSASSRNSRALALARLVEHIPPELANEIAYRLITVHRQPHLSASDTWEIDSNVPLSRTRMNTGAAHLSDNVLRAAARAWACARVPAGPMNEEERLFASYALQASVALLRSDQVNTRVRGARCVSSLAKGSSELSAQAAGLTLHGCEHVRAIGVAHVPHTDPLLAVLAADPTARVRAAVAARAKDLPEPVRHTLARDSHAAVRRTLGAALG